MAGPDCPYISHGGMVCENLSCGLTIQASQAVAIVHLGLTQYTVKNLNGRVVSSISRWRRSPSVIYVSKIENIDTNIIKHLYIDESPKSNGTDNLW